MNNNIVLELTKKMIWSLAVNLIKNNNLGIICLFLPDKK